MSSPPRPGVQFGFPRHHLASVDSTNRLARDLAPEAPAGTVVSAAEQTAGRGRHGRGWATPTGRSLAYSAILKPLDRPRPLLPITVGIAVCEAAAALGAQDVGLKWPNDVLLGNAKLAGILVEARAPEWAVIGIGVNLNIAEADLPEEPRQSVASLGADVGFDQAVAALNAALTRWIAAPDAEVLIAFHVHDILTGSQITWSRPNADPATPTDSPLTGKVLGINESGHLLVQSPDGQTVPLDSGEVSLRRS